MANNRLSAAFAAAVLACCCSVGAFAEAASSDSASEPAVSVAASEPAVSSETASPPDLSDSALDNATTYTPAEITEILKAHPNAFTTAADPASSSAADPAAASSAAPDTVPAADLDQQQSIEPGTIWLKPFNSYTPAEGYLLLLTVIALSGAAFKLIKYLWL